MELSLRKAMVAAAVVVCMSGGGLGAQEMPKEIIISAEADFMTYCAVCHGRTGIGDGPVAKDLVTNPSDLTQLAKANGGTFPEDRVQKVIDGREELMGHGTRDMPIWGNWFKFIARTQDAEGADEITSEIIVSLRIQGMIEYLKTIQAK